MPTESPQPVPNVIRLKGLTIGNYARQLRMDIRSTSAYCTDLQTDGIRDNLLAVVDVWEQGQLAALDEQLYPLTTASL